MDVTRRSVLTAGLIASAGLPTLIMPAPVGARAQPRYTADNPLRIQILLYDGFEIIDALGPFDFLDVASKAGAALQTTLATVNGATEVTALGGLPVRPTAAFDGDVDIMMVPGAPQVWRANEMPEGLAEVLHARRATGKPIYAVCTGAVFLARTGLLEGRNAISGSGALEVLESLGANVIHGAHVVDDGDIWSCRGPTAGFDLSLYLIERYFGSQLAFKTSQIFEYDRQGVVWRASDEM